MNILVVLCQHHHRSRTWSNRAHILKMYMTTKMKKSHKRSWLLKPNSMLNATNWPEIIKVVMASSNRRYIWHQRIQHTYIFKESQLPAISDISWSKLSSNHDTSNTFKRKINGRTIQYHPLNGSAYPYAYGGFNAKWYWWRWATISYGQQWNWRKWNINRPIYAPCATSLKQLTIWFDVLTSLERSGVSSFGKN